MAQAKYPVPKGIHTNRFTPRFFAVFSIAVWSVAMAYCVPILRQAEIPSQVLFQSVLKSGKSEWSIRSESGKCLGTLSVEIPNDSRLQWSGDILVSRNLLGLKEGAPERVVFRGEAEFTIYRWAEHLQGEFSSPSLSAQIESLPKNPKEFRVLLRKGDETLTQTVERPQPILLVPEGRSGYTINLIPSAQLAISRILSDTAVESVAALRFEPVEKGCSEQGIFGEKSRESTQGEK